LDALNTILRRAWRGDAVSEEDPNAAELGRRVREACETWGGVEVDLPTFAAFLRERLEPETDLAGQLLEMPLPQVYLAAACLAGSAPAAAHFLEHVRDAVTRGVARVGGLAPEDALQVLYEHLFLRGTDSKISGYTGRGDLRRWTTVVAVRLSLDARRQQRSREARGATLPLIEQGIVDAELQHLRGAYRVAFKEAFTDAVDRLEVRERNVLRFHLEGLTADQIGKIYSVHRVTVARWLSGIRARLLQGSRAALRERLSSVEQDLDSIERLVSDEWSVSFERILGAQSRQGPTRESSG